MTKEELEKQKWNDIFLEDCAVYDKKIAEEYTTLQERIERLEKENLVLHEMNVKRIDLQKENEELKDKLNNLASVAEVRLANWQKYEKENKELKADIETMIPLLGKAKDMSESLRKAEKLIKELCSMVRELNNPNVQLTNVDYSLKEAEQFLKESE